MLPDTAAEKDIRKGEVLATGPGYILKDGKRAEMPVKVGEIILYQQYAATTVEVDGDELAIIRQGDILAVCEGVVEENPARVTMEEEFIQDVEAVKDELPV